LAHRHRGGLDPIESYRTAGGKLFVTYLKDVTTRAYVHSLDGKLENEVALPGPGSASGFDGPHDAPFVFYTFNSLNVPPTIYRYDIASRASNVFRAQGAGLRRVRVRDEAVFLQEQGRHVDPDVLGLPQG
jgi:prolyl oligopeptidase